MSKTTKLLIDTLALTIVLISVAFLFITSVVKTGQKRCERNAEVLRCEPDYDIVKGCRMKNCQSTGSTFLDALRGAVHVR